MEYYKTFKNFGVAMSYYKYMAKKYGRSNCKFSKAGPSYYYVKVYKD